MSNRPSLLSQVLSWGSGALNHVRKLTARELKRLGFSPSTKKYVRAELQRVTKRTEFVSYRQVRKAVAPRETAHEKLFKDIREGVTGITQSDASLIRKRKERGRGSLSQSEQTRFYKLFSKYNRDEILELFPQSRERSAA